MVGRADLAAHRLAPLLKMPAQEVAAKIRSAPGSFVWLKRHLSVDQAQAVERARLPGVGLKWEYQRSYPNGNLASPLLGFVGTEGRGLSGLELVFNEWLADSQAPRRSLKDGRGADLSLSLSEPEEDRTWVRLTLDRTLQYIAERELEWGMQRSRARAGVILVQDPWTGEILAAASRPQHSSAGKRPAEAGGLSIPAAQWVFEPGSTFKVVTAAAALEEGRVKFQEVMDCERGSWRYADLTINDHEPEGLLTFAQAMEVSSNIALAKVGIRLGKEKLYDYIRAFGFGSRTGSEIPGESAGLLRPLPKWSGVSLPVISFGQEVGVTVLQLACAYSALANGGTLMEPRLYQEARNQWGEKRRWDSSMPVRRVISPQTAEALKKILEGVVLRGTGHDAFLEGWGVAGKTGTAQKIDPALKRYSPDKFVASFCGFVPTSKPRLTIVVIYDEPKGLAWGGYNAGPVFRNVAWHAMTYLGVPSEAPVQLAGERPRKPQRT
jgi:cell division protein FtsI (penicillin-binding protein 3)